jgi:hypothetical protein
MRYAALALVTALIGIGVFWYSVVRLPSAKVEAARAEMIAQAGGPNRLLHQPLPDADWRLVVRPSTDLLYSALAYDLAEGPLELTFPPHDDYWSVQFIDLHTSSFAHVGGAAGTTEPTRVVLADNTLPGEEQVILAPTTRGVVLLRYLVRDPATDVPALDVLRREAVVSRL